MINPTLPSTFGSIGLPYSAPMADMTSQQVQPLAPEPQLLTPQQSIALTKSHAASLAPILRAQLAANRREPRLDLSGSQSWSEGLAKGIGNIVGMRNQTRDEQQQQQYINDYQSALEAQARQDADNQARAQLAQQARDQMTVNQLNQAVPGLGDYWLNSNDAGRNQIVAGVNQGNYDILHKQAQEAAVRAQLDQLNTADNPATPQVEGPKPADVTRLRLYLGAEPTTPLDIMTKQQALDKVVLDNRKTKGELQYQAPKNEAELQGQILENQKKFYEGALKKAESELAPLRQQYELAGDKLKLSELQRKSDAITGFHSLVNSGEFMEMAPAQQQIVTNGLKTLGINVPEYGQKPEIKSFSKGGVLKSKQLYVARPDGSVQLLDNNLQPKGLPLQLGR